MHKNIAKIEKDLDIETALDNFVSRYIEAHKLNNRPMVTEFTRDWVSPCLKGNNFDSVGEGEEIQWQPILWNNTQGLDDLAKALEVEIDPSLLVYYTRYLSNNMDASTQRGELQLIFPWNHDDFAQLQENLIGHVLMKRRLGQEDTFFIGVTDEEDFIISLDNATGQVMLEQVGLAPKDVLANSLAEFLDTLTPVISAG